MLTAQQSSVTSTSSVNINGDRVPDGPSVIHSKSDGRSETTEVVQSINAAGYKSARVIGEAVVGAPKIEVVS